MTISATTNRATYTGNGATTEFAFSYPFHAQADLVVISTVIATGVQTTKALTTHYTISGSTDSLGHYSSGGTITFLTAPASTERITIYRDPARTQTMDLIENDNLPAETVEAQFDYVTLLIQRLGDMFNRSLRQPEGDSADIDVLPSTVSRASKYLGFDSDGDPVALDAPADTTAVTSFAATVLDDTDAATVRATLGVDQKVSETGQIAFPATAVPSADPNTLDDYEEGTWTPSVGGTATYTTQLGRYVKVGRVVTISGILTINAIGTGSTSEISGLPFAVGSNMAVAVPVMFSSLASNVVALVAYAALGSSTLSLRGLAAAGADLATGTHLGNSTSIAFSGAYLTD